MVAIVRGHRADNLVIVVSAMNKMTNTFEKLIHAYLNKSDETATLLDKIEKFHTEIAQKLFGKGNHPAHEELARLFGELRSYVSTNPVPHYDFEYDQIVIYGELLSSAVTSHALLDAGIDHKLFDARQLIKTNASYRAALIEPDRTDEAILNFLSPMFNKTKRKKKIALTQGFIGESYNFHSTTLGREGSDYTAALLAFVLNAKEVIIWKDVPGVLTADPERFGEADKIDELSYQEALMMAYYGAKVIHPKTIRPLQRKSIPLYVKSFFNPKAPGTIVHNIEGEEKKVTSLIVKKDQVLISVYPSDFSFLTSENHSEIFSLLSKYKLNINLVQNTALRFSFCVDDDPAKTDALLSNLESQFRIQATPNIEVLTVRHYTPEAIEKALQGSEVLLEQRSPITCQMAVKVQ
jgi:aspartate kinase